MRRGYLALTAFDAAPYPSPVSDALAQERACIRVPAGHNCSEGIHWTARRISQVAGEIICEQRRDECRIAIQLLLGHIRGRERTAVLRTCLLVTTHKAVEAIARRSWNLPGSGV